MAPKSGSKGTHDITILPSGGSRAGYMLAKQNGKRVWEMKDVDFYPPGYTTSAPSYTNTPPRVETPLQQDNFAGGFGEVDKDTGNMFWGSDGADAGTKGRVYPAAKKVEEVQPVIPNGTFPDTAGWVPTNCTLSVASGALRLTNTATANGSAYHDLTWSSAYIGQAFCLNFDLKRVTGASITVIVTDGGTGSWTLATPVTSTDFVKRCVSGIFTATATRCRVTVQMVATNTLDCMFDNLEYITPICLCLWSGTTYLARGTMLQKWVDATCWTYVHNFTSAITDLCVYQDAMYIALGNSIAYEWTADGTTYTANTAYPTTKAVLFGVVGSVLYYQRSNADPVIALNQGISYSTTPANARAGTVAGSYEVGDATQTITDIIDDPKTVYICKSNGIYTISAAGAVSYYVKELVNLTNANTGKQSLNWMGNYYIPAGTTTLFEIDSSGVISDLSPNAFAIDQSGYRSRICALCGDHRFLYAVAQTGTTAILLKGRYLNLNGTTAWRWYPLKSMTLSAVYGAIIDAGSPRKLHIAGNKMVFYYHPEGYGDLDADTNYQFDTAGDFITSYEHGNFKGYTKAYHSVTVLSEQCAKDAQTIDVYYRVTKGGSWTFLGTITASPSEVLYWTSLTTGKYIQLKFQLKTTNTATCPILNAYVVSSRLKPTIRREFTFAIALAEQQVNANGTIITMDVPTMHNTLIALATEKWPMVLGDIVGSDYYVDVTDLRVTDELNEETKDAEKWVWIKATEAKLAASVLEAPATTSGTPWWSELATETYATVHDKTTGLTGNNNSSQGGVWQTYTGASPAVAFTIVRDSLFFDTSALPGGAVISAATISLFGVGHGDLNDDVVIVSGADLEEVTVAADYGELLNDTVSRGTFTGTLANWLDEAYNVITLNDTGISEIVKRGTTKFGIRCANDINSVTPEREDPNTTYRDGAWWYGTTINNKKPKLTIWYT